MSFGKVDKKIVEWYQSRGKNLCILNSSKALVPKYRGKQPLSANWPTRAESLPALIDTAQSGGNLGFVLGPNDVVIDVDPRNGGLEGLKVLENDLHGIDLAAICPVVDTGGGGLHFYLSKSPTEKIRKKCTRYPGVDFITEGGFVVIPGSYHYLCKKYYSFNELSAYDEKKFPPIPEVILKFLRKEREPGEPLHKSFSNSPNLSNEDLEKLLSLINPEDYRGKHDDWLSLMFACHHATNGDGRRAFADWCIRDPKYAADEGLILYRWDSVLDDEENLVTYRTLLKAVKSADGEIPEDIDRKIKIAEFDIEEFSAVADFDATIKAVEDDEDDYGPADDEERAAEYAKKEEIREKTGQTKYAALMVVVSGLTNESVTTDKIEKIAKLCKGFDDISVGKIQAAICKYAKLPLPAVRKVFAQVRRDETKRDAFDNVPKDILGPLEEFSGDIVPIAVARILKEKFRHGYTICRGQDGEVWVYEGKIWRPLNSAEVQGVMREALALADKETTDLAKNMQKCKIVLDSVLRTIDFTKQVDEKYDIYNFQNCEIWVNSETGQRVKRPHSFNSHQTAVLSYDFSVDAQCPTFSKCLPGILSCYGNAAKDVERHLWELFGYTLTGRKNIAAFVALTGPGGNGKSQILNALSAVLKCENESRAVFGSLSDFGSGRSAHAFSQLVGKLAFIDDDFDYGGKLSSDVLKKISENKNLSSNPKYKQPFTFENRAICWLASNAWPYTGDGSNGVRRRAHIFNLTNKFEQGKNANLELPETIKAEAAGIFNRMIAGLIRLRKRGFFQIPEVLQETAFDWQVKTNPVAAFLCECNPAVLKSTADTYDAYKDFCYGQGRGDKISMPRMIEMIEALGCRVAGGQIILDEKFILKNSG